MTIPQKLQAIRRLSGCTQAELAQKLGVSFVTVNRWIAGKALPRRRAQERIDALYRTATGLTVIPADALAAKKAMLMEKAKRTKNVLRMIMGNPDIRDQFVLVLTHTSNAIEGSTLTEAETAAVLFHNVALRNRTLTEQLEAKNHQAALLALFDHLSAKEPFDEVFLLKLHGMLLNGIRADAGAYRHHAVRIVGAHIPTANYLKVPHLMKELMDDIHRHPKDCIAHVATIHACFEQIHPFADGNGRIGRLLMHAMFLAANFPPAVIPAEERRFYYAALNTAQRRGDTHALQDFFCDSVLLGWDIVGRRW